MGAAPRTQRAQRVARSRALVAGELSEAQWQAQVIGMARALGWMVYHGAQAWTANGRPLTAVQGDGAGFPDLVLVHAQHGVLFRELKRDKNAYLSHKQQRWRDQLRDAGSDWALWRPRDVLQVERELRGVA